MKVALRRILQFPRKSKTNFIRHVTRLRNEPHNVLLYYENGSQKWIGLERKVFNWDKFLIYHERSLKAWGATICLLFWMRAVHLTGRQQVWNSTFATFMNDAHRKIQYFWKLIHRHVNISYNSNIGFYEFGWTSLIDVLFCIMGVVVNPRDASSYRKKIKKIFLEINDIYC